jgi:Ni,Fe-hydrogenase I large subunit
MAHVGHVAAGMNIFLDIPLFLRGVSQSLYGSDGPELRISTELLTKVREVDPLDPTSVVEEYLHDWWNYEKEWKTHPIESDPLEGFQWHIKKVNEIFIYIWFW